MKSCGLMENGCIFHQHSKPSSSGNAESICCICSVFGSLKSFHTVNGKAYLFNKVVNISVGVHEEKMMMTGMYTVADIFCVGCGSIVGWRYETAHEKAQKYKEGKSVLQRIKISGPDGSNYGSDADDA
ncbi:protein yippee-like isoform X1 [Vitis vinifera]|uniref:Protein yippee-like n=1 Tax=Vitis vinifera TaxID=29760 RepID=A0A438D5B8_VITVI|nr:protein yippee-like isoform X1 [Vitis vinifera]XP_019079459.1 protein yippee-like isoform X1 [Vitis vinifera]RVW30689.1 Protein yippee-like [Vitis vinifera]|eukprot:XP_010658287.1 PREDICTED: protein yippee-like isoform X1 [Vitis vinifera]